LYTIDSTEVSATTPVIIILGMDLHPKPNARYVADSSLEINRAISSAGGPQEVKLNTKARSQALLMCACRDYYNLIVMVALR